MFPSATDRVLVGLDGSESSLQAARWAVDEARRRGRDVTLLCAVQPPVIVGSVGAGIPPSLDLVEDWQVRAMDMLDKAAADLGVPDARKVVSVGSASEVLIEHSEGAELLVIGSRGRGGFSGLVLGSVGTQVAPHARCPVVVFRGEPRTDAKKVVVGIDGSPTGQAALAFAFDEASRRGLSVVVVHAWEMPTYDLIAMPDASLSAAVTEFSDEEIRLTAEALAGFRDRYPDVPVEERLIRGSASAALVQAESDAALIVVGSRGHGPSVGALLGSVSHGVLHKAHVPVAVIPRRAVEEHAA